MKIPNVQDMRELDAATCKAESIDSAELMERAAQRVADFIKQRYAKNRPMVVFAGPGGNGGDGLAVARMLSESGYRVQAFLFNTTGALSADCRLNSERLADCPDANFVEVTSQFEAPEVKAGTVIVDALFGTGINKPLNGGYAALVAFINNSGAEVVSIDMPTGLMTEDNNFNVRSSIVRATHTLTFQLPKLAQLLADNHLFVGELHLLDIGLSKAAIDAMESRFFLTEAAEVKRMIKHRSPFGHKGTFGHALLIAGKYGMAGAAVLLARACLRSGVGKVTLHTPKKNNDILQIAVPEAVLSHDNDENIFTAPLSVDGYNALAIGPGIGTDKRTALALIEQVSRTRVPLVMDADAINILGDRKGWIQQVPKDTVFTPHPGEMRRLGICNADSLSTLNEAMEMAQRHQFYIVLKGHFTAVCTPEGRVYFNPTGGSGLSTAGSGDVLTGVITALLAQKYSIENACRLGVYLHGLAGDIASERLGEEGVTAGDIIAALPDAFKALKGA